MNFQKSEEQKPNRNICVIFYFAIIIIIKKIVAWDFRRSVFTNLHSSLILTSQLQYFEYGSKMAEILNLKVIPLFGHSAGSVPCTLWAKARYLFLPYGPQRKPIRIRVICDCNVQTSVRVSYPRSFNNILVRWDSCFCHFQKLKGLR